jgi:hypothetical protein
MRAIAAARLGGLDPKSKLIDQAWAVFDKVAAGITEKKPGIAEFIALVAYLRATDDGAELTDERRNGALRIFNKTKADLATADLTVAAAAR